MVEVVYFKTPLSRYTFDSPKIMDWIVKHCTDKYVLNLFAGKNKLSHCCEEVRNDKDVTMNADHHMDALNFVKAYPRFQPCRLFEVVVLDPPYSFRKSMEMYNGHRASRFNQVKDALPTILVPDGRVITFGYHSVSMGMSRGFEQEEILLMSHGGAIHDTIAVVEKRIK